MKIPEEILEEAKKNIGWNPSYGVPALGSIPDSVAIEAIKIAQVESACNFSEWIMKQSPEIRQKENGLWYDSGLEYIPFGESIIPVYGEEKLIGTTQQVYEIYLKHNCNTAIGINSLMNTTTGTAMNYSHGKKNCDCKEPCNANTCIGRATDFNK